MLENLKNKGRNNFFVAARNLISYSPAMPRSHPSSISDAERASIAAEIGERALRRREQARLTQREAAERAGMTSRSWQDLEAGRPGSSLERLIAAARAVRCTLGDLLPPSILK